MAEFQDEGFSTKLLTYLDNQRKNKLFTDFTIKVEDTLFPCHKNIIYATSPYFHAMLESQMSETCKDEVEIDSLMVKPSIMEQLLGYMYSGNITIYEDYVKDIVRSSDFLLLESVKDKCSSFIKRLLTVKNCIEWYRFADKYSLPDLVCASRDIMQNEFIEVSRHEEFLSMTLSEIIEYIKDEKLNVRNEDVVVDACMKWVDHDVENRKEFLNDLLKKSHLSYCTDMYLEYTLKKNLAFLMETGNYRLVNDARLSLLNGTVKPAVTRKCYLPVNLVTLGGRKTNGEDNANCWALNDMNSWNNCLRIPDSQAKCFISVCAIPGGCLVTGGRVSSSGAPTNGCFSLVRGIWEERASMIMNRYGHGSLGLGKCIYVLGGVDKTLLPVNSVEILEGLQYKWVSVAPMLHTVCFPILANLDLDIYVILSRAEANKSVHEKYGISVQKYSTVTNKWKFMSNLPSDVTSTRGASATVLKDSMYLVGGVDKLCMQYMAEDDSWIFLSQPLHCHCYCPTITLEEKLWMLGGINSKINTSTATDVIEEYDPARNTWKISAVKLPDKICYLKAVLMQVQ